MANIRSAKKRIHVIEKKTASNRRIKDEIKLILKEFEMAMKAGNLEDAEEQRNLAEKKLLKAASRHTVSKQHASRKISQLTKRLNAAKSAK